MLGQALTVSWADRMGVRMRAGCYLVAALVIGITPSCTRNDGLSPRAMQAAACMVRVAQTVSGVDRARWGVTNAENNGPGTRLFVEYTYNISKNSEITIRYIEDMFGSGHSFQTIIPGIGPPPRIPPVAMPEDWGMNRVQKLWWSQCRVSAWGIFG